jgi:polyisoprenoid-binding protein YceI
MKSTKSVFATILVIILATNAMKAAASEYGLDPDHTQIGFSVKHMVISSVKGSFDKFSGSFTVNKANQLTSANAKIDVTSINTKAEKRDKHLKSPEFFSQKEFPYIEFTTKKIVNGNSSSSSGGKVVTSTTVVGDLTIKGITKSVTLTGEMVGPIKDFRGNSRLGLHLEGKINRKDYNVAFHAVLEAGGLVVGDEVTIILDIEGVERL